MQNQEEVQSTYSNKHYRRKSDPYPITKFQRKIQNRQSFLKYWEMRQNHQEQYDQMLEEALTYSEDLSDWCLYENLSDI